MIDYVDFDDVEESNRNRLFFEPIKGKIYLKENLFYSDSCFKIGEQTTTIQQKENNHKIFRQGNIKNSREWHFQCENDTRNLIDLIDLIDFLSFKVSRLNKNRWKRWDIGSEEKILIRKGGYQQIVIEWGRGCSNSTSDRGCWNTVQWFSSQNARKCENLRENVKFIAKEKRLLLPQPQPPPPQQQQRPSYSVAVKSRLVSAWLSEIQDAAFRYKYLIVFR